METTGTREEQTTLLCRILVKPVKHWVFILILVLLFLALYMVVFAGEIVSTSCDLQRGNDRERENDCSLSHCNSQIMN